MTNNVVFLLCSPQASWGGERTPLGAPKNHENAQRRKWLIARTEINRRMRTGWAVVSASRPVTVKVRLWMSGRERPSRVRRVWPLATAFHPTYVSRDAEVCISAVLAMTDAAKTTPGLNRGGRGQ